MTKIVRPTAVKRALVALADFALFLFVVLGFFAAGQTIATSSPYGSGLRRNIESYQLDSGLYFADEDGNAKPYDNLASYEAYQEKLLHFYTVFLVSGCPAEYRCNYDVYWYNVHILGLEDVRKQYGNDSILEPGYSQGKNLFQYPSEGGVQNVDAVGIPKASLHVDGNLEKPLTAEAKQRLLSFYYDPTMRNQYFNAGQLLYYSAFYQRDISAYQTVTNILPVAISVALSGLIFYVLFPLVFKDGQTLGKKAFGLAVIGAGGYKAKKPQILLRQLPPIALAAILFTFASFSIAVMVSSLALLISYVLAIATKFNQAIHDFLGYTIVVSEKDSVFYRNEAEEAAAQKAFDEAMKEADALLEKGEEILRQEEREKASK